MPHVLIVDDDPVHRMFIREVLSADNAFTFTEANNGLQALECAQIELPDAVILDIRMPSIDGLTTLRLLKNDPAFQRTAVILITALDPIDMDEQPWVARADGFLLKPFDGEALITMVGQALGRSQRPAME